MKKETKMIVGTVVTIGALLGVGSFWMQKNSFAPKTEAKTTTQSNPSVLSWESRLIKSHNPRKGSDMAKVKIVEFLDPECESCAAFHPTLKQLMQEYPQDVQLIVRYMIYHGNSKPAAIAAEAAGRQGKHSEMLDLLFTRKEWTHQTSSQILKFEGFAKEIGLNIEKFRSDMQDPELAKNVTSDFEEGPSLGVQGTPTFFVNGQQVQELSYQAMHSKIEEELKK